MVWCCGGVGVSLCLDYDISKRQLGWLWDGMYHTHTTHKHVSRVLCEALSGGGDR